MRTPVAAVLAAALTSAAVARAARADGDKLHIVTTLHVLAAIAQEIGGDRVSSDALARAVEDPHEVTGTPARAKKLSEADAFIESGFQLEIWDDNIINDSRNTKIQKSANGFCKAGQGEDMLQVPQQLTRALGDIHPMGNPHIWFEPFVGHIYAKNIEACLSRIDPQNAQLWEKNRKAFDKKLDEAVFGEELCKIFGSGARLEKLTREGKLDAFLSEHKVPKGFDHAGEPLAAALGGLMKKAAPLKGANLVAYHLSWPYFEQTWGCKVVGCMEPKPGIPPTSGHLEELAATAKRENAKAILVMSYEPRSQAEEFAQTIGGTVALMPSDVDADEKAKDFISFQTLLVERAVEALEKVKGK